MNWSQRAKDCRLDGWHAFDDPRSEEPFQGSCSSLSGQLVVTRLVEHDAHAGGNGEPDVSYGISQIGNHRY